MTFDSTNQGRRWRVLAYLFAGGLILRLVLLWSTTSLFTPIVDEQQYRQLALNVLDGDGFAWSPGEPTSLRPPMYPTLLAGIWAVAGHDNMQAVRIVQILLALLTTFVVYQLGRRAFGSAVGEIGAITVWLYPSLIFFNFTILTETLFTFLLTLFVLLTVMLVQTPRWWIAALSGLTLGVAALTRSVLWPLPLIVCPMIVVLMGRPLPKRLAFSALFLMGYLVAVGPWAIRNTRLQGVVTIVDTMGGLNLRMGNYENTPDDHMWDAVRLRGDLNWSHELSVERPGEKFTEGQKDKWAQAKAVQYILANPLTTLRRAVIKFGDFWGLEREFAAGIQKGLYRPPFVLGLLASGLIVLAYIGVATMGVSGIWTAAPDTRFHLILLLPVLFIMGIHTIVFGHSRYHLPLIPILALYAAAFATRTGSFNRRHLAGAAGAVLILVTIWIHQLGWIDAGHIRALLETRPT
jgi:4-amino-4-deoxy-L-arabinose transferase-like glycosyltransferase